MPSVSTSYDLDGLRRALAEDRAKYGFCTQLFQGSDGVGHPAVDLSDPPVCQPDAAGQQPGGAPRVRRWDDDYDLAMDVDEEEDHVGMTFISDEEV